MTKAQRRLLTPEMIASLRQWLKSPSGICRVFMVMTKRGLVELKLSYEEAERIVRSGV